ncbi:hypothetical protein ONS95_006579 [Cadophora gregata]|uniref:uncharacterized protein n=1 Tax=Cadophora gregata TaxID=51156 RepID=UPI0026DC2EC4|nr:uncharacterized protein ONS95_006579 [Cadophora gregata]KAK0101405.1 hypothetical protein ONS95_006579 [Cadophora gregata]KAK0106584.1 hypothetical protein ONS96_004205 [Cadophora gregata f. sp. sojae]
MNSTLPPDPYKLLGVTKDAKLPEIRSAHRKLVLKCHPDKVQDAALKAIKQDEFQKVQQAYELLSDNARRLQYDEQVKLFELRKEMGRGNPTPRSNPFEYEVKTAEPRANSYGRPKVYSHPTSVPRSNEEVYEDRHMPRKSASNESASDRKRAAMKEEELRYREAAARKMEDERLRQKERERETAKRAHREKKKSSDKDRRKGTEEKVRSRHATYVEDDSSDEEIRRLSTRAETLRSAERERKQRQRIEEEIRIREESARAAEAAAARHAQEHQRPKEAPMNEKWNEHKQFAGAYMLAARRKVAPVDTDLSGHPGMPRRAETFSASSTPAYVRYTTTQQPQYSDEDMPKRSSAGRKESSRRSSETPAARTEKSSRRRSPPAPTSDPYIVEPPSPTTAPRKPPLQTYTSAPPVFTREQPSRSKTQDYPRKEAAMPPLPRAATFQSGDRSRASGSSKLRQQYTSDSEPDSPVYQQSSRPRSPPPTRRSEPTRYIVENGKTVPVQTSRPHRSEMREEYPQDRSESPRGTPARPPLARNPPSSERPRANRTQSTTYYQSEPEPIVLTARPKFEGSGQRGSSRGPAGGAYFDNVQYGTKYQPEHVIYSNHAAGLQDYARRGSDGRDRDYYSRGTPLYT